MEESEGKEHESKANEEDQRKSGSSWEESWGKCTSWVEQKVDFLAYAGGTWSIWMGIWDWK